MNYYVLTLFPEMIEQAAETSILGRAIKKGVISLSAINIRDYSQNKFNRVDDYPYGGGAGMVIEPEPVYQAVQEAKKRIGHDARVVYLTPQAKVFTQTKAESFARDENLILLCGHYEGIDDRVLEEVVTDYVSIGDYVLTGGELGALVVMDAVSRFVPGVLGNEESSQFESLQDNLLEYPHYTRPTEWHGRKVPDILLSGDHSKVEEWRYRQSLIRTKERRPDLLKGHYQVSLIRFGEEREDSCHALIGALTRQGQFLDYSRKKLQKHQRKLSANDLLVFDMESLKDTESSAEEIFRNLYGDHTPCVLIYRTKGADCTGHGTLEEDALSMEKFLTGRGFDILASRDLSGEDVIDYALCLREKMEDRFAEGQSLLPKSGPPDHKTE